MSLELNKSMTTKPQIYRHRFIGTAKTQTRETIRLIGNAIKKCSEYLPIRNHAASVATEAKPKNYIQQLTNLYDDFVKRWRYVKDPAFIELLTVSPVAVSKYILALDNIGVGRGYGAGDCDCATIGLGSEIVSIGFPIRICTTAQGQGGNLFSHVFAQAFVNGFGWITMDPVLYPNRNRFDIAPHTRIAYWDIYGNLLAKKGNIIGDI